MKTLLAGWFSFERMGATAGDLMARDLACRWLEEAGVTYEIAVAPPFSGGVDWRTVDPGSYSQVVFVCGPFGNGWPLTGFLSRFSGCPLVGLNVSMLDPLQEWNPFSFLLERDSSVTSRPDISILAPLNRVPVVGLVLRDASSEYGGRHRYEPVKAAIERFLASREMAVVPIDTRLDSNSTGLRTPSEIESLIARVDVVLTTRLHGLVLAIKNGIPALAIDPIAGSAKIKRQADTMGWPVILTPETLEDVAVQHAFDYCLSENARRKARECCERAVESAKRARQEFLQAMARPSVAVER